MSGPVTIYALVDEGGVVHYVGQTRRVDKRRYEHRRGHPTLTMIALARTDEEHADAVERAWMERYRSQGFALLNAPGYRRGGRGHAEPAVVLQVRLPRCLFDRVEQLARSEERSIPWMTRRLIEGELEALAARAAPVPAAPVPQQEVSS